MIRVRTAGGNDIKLFDSSSTDSVDGIGQSTRYSNFLIQGIEESRMEKQQIIETFGEDYVYFFGERPRFLNVSGCLLNTSDFNWKSEFWANYEEHLRGTRLVEQNARVYLYFDDVVVEGYFLAATAQQRSDNPHMMPFSFQFYVSNYAILGKVGSIYFGTSDTGGTANVGLEPFDLTTRQTDAAVANSIGSPGGLNGFLAAATQYANNASFAIQSTLETFKEFYFARKLVVPTGLDSQAAPQPTIKFDPNTFGRPPGARRDDTLGGPDEAVPIHEMYDEYVEREPPALNAGLAAASKAETARVGALLAAQSPQALSAIAKAKLAESGVDVTSRTTTMLLLGRGAFAAAQYAAAFGIAQASGTLQVGGLHGQLEQAADRFLL